MPRIRLLECLLLVVVAVFAQFASASPPRPYLYGCGVVWGNWLGLPVEEAKAFDRVQMDAIRAAGGTNVGANFAWIDIEPRPGEFHWDYVDHQVTEASKRGLEIFAYTGLTPDWALPPEAPKTPGIGYRFPPDEKYIAQFEAFFTQLARRYKGKVKYYEFWNEPNGCSWINEGCSNGDMAATYAPWLIRWYRAMKAGDPDSVLAVGGLDYHAGVKEGWRWLEDLYASGAGNSFDAVALHPYGEPLHWQAIEDTYAVLARHGQGHKKLWLNEYGWNTRDEATKAANLTEVLTELVKPKYHYVFQANYLVLTDLPDANDATGHDYGLCSRDRKALTVTPRASYEAFRALPKHWSREDLARWEAEQGPLPPPEKAEVPDGFMLTLTAPGCEPGSDCDDVGPPWKLRDEAFALTGANIGHCGLAWGDTEPSDPGEGPSTYDFSHAKLPDRAKGKQYLICELTFFGNPWAEQFRFSDRERYNRLLERWAEAACRFAREEWGVTLFSAGGNERDLVAQETYSPHFPDWHFFYMDPIKAIHRGMKAADADNRLIIGNLCYSDREHIGALYAAGAKGNFEVLAIHAYGPRGCYLDMEQVLESHQELAAHGDSGIPIILTEGWSCFPLPDSIDKDPIWRKGGRDYTPQEIEHYRQTVLDGWRNLNTPRPGEYDPSWVRGASYFVLNDHWGGRGWEQRATPKYDAAGKLTGFLLDGYFLGTSDPDYIKPLLRPWGLIDVEGKPKGDTIEAFPPALPRVELTAIIEDSLKIVNYNPRFADWMAPSVTPGKAYRVAVTLTNKEAEPLSQVAFRVGDKQGMDFPGGYSFVYQDGILTVLEQPGSDPLVSAKLLNTRVPRTVQPGQTLRLEYEVTFSKRLAEPTDRGWLQRVRPYAEVWFVLGGRPWHTDAWLPRVTAVPPAK